MGSIVLQTDDETSLEYERLGDETKQMFITEANSLLQRTCRDARLEKLNQIIGQMNNGQVIEGVSIDLLFKLLPVD